MIVDEPDALGTLKCLRASRRGARMRLLAYGVKVLSRLPNAAVYIDAEAPDWEDAGTVARKLKAVGVGRVRGFALNVTHMATTRSNIRFGLAVSKRIGGKHFIVNTSSNGDGPDNHLPRGKRWCNPPNAAAGALPTARPRTRRSTPTCGWSGRASPTVLQRRSEGWSVVGEARRRDGGPGPLVAVGSGSLGCPAR